LGFFSRLHAAMTVLFHEFDNTIWCCLALVCSRLRLGFSHTLKTCQPCSEYQHCNMGLLKKKRKENEANAHCN